MFLGTWDILVRAFILAGPRVLVKPWKPLLLRVGAIVRSSGVEKVYTCSVGYRLVIVPEGVGHVDTQVGTGAPDVSAFTSSSAF